MEACHLCGTETEYYGISLPTCLTCSGGLNAKPTRTPIPTNDVQPKLADSQPYRVTEALSAFDPEEKRAFTIPSGSLIEKEESFKKLGVVNIEWKGRVVLVQVQDLIERIEPG
jgi:hypothetical protein